MLYVWLLLIFIVGAMVGSFINVCVHRLPYEKSVLWPLGSRCGSCVQPIKWYDNIPLVSYWVLRGRCRKCGAKFSVRYFVVELVTALGFVGILYVEIVLNVHGSAFINNHAWMLNAGLIPWPCWLWFGFHAALFSFLLTASLCDLEHMEMPISITLVGTVVGLISATALAWPWPEQPLPLWMAPAGQGALVNPANPPFPRGLYPWPVWYDLAKLQLPDWLKPGGNWQTGLATGLAGALLGTFLLRAVASIFFLGRGVEGLGMGDADLMMMAGAFLGWQLILVGFFLSVVPALLFGIGQLIFRRQASLPFIPSLSVGVLATMLCWRWIGPRVLLVLFDPLLMGVLVVALPIMLFIVSFALRLVRGSGEQVHAADCDR